MRIFITIAIALCLTAPLLAAENTCVSPCVECSLPSAENYECELCWGQELKAAVAPATLKACAAGTLPDNCQVPSTTADQCIMCKTGYTLNQTTKACYANAEITGCLVWGEVTGTAGTSVCKVCNGLKAPTVDTGVACDVTAAAITNCKGYSADDTCGACDSGFIFNKSDNSCVAEVAANMGCGQLNGAVCEWCNATAGYYATSFTAAAGSTCTKNTTVLFINFIFAMIFASLF